MSKLADKLRASRESWERAGDYEFLVRRPTGLQVAQWASATKVDIIPRVVFGWRRSDGTPLQEIDVLRSGAPIPIEYDADVLIEWIGDNAELFLALVAKIDEALMRSSKANEDAAKNSTSS